jgi:hypothetical protein
VLNNKVEKLNKLIESLNLDEDSYKNLVDSISDVVNHDDNGTHNTTENTTVPVNLSFLSDSPTVQAEISSSNCLFVENYNVIPNSCGAGTVQLFGKTIYLNMCDMNETVTVNLNIEVDGQRLYNVPFEVKKATDNVKLQISDTLIKK